MGRAGFPGFGRRGRVPPAMTGLDFHSHLLPCVDDGVAGLAEAVAAITALRRLGFTGAVLTPHVYKGVFDNEAGGLRAAFAGFVAALAAADVAFTLHLAAEYFADEHFLDLIERDDVLWVAVGAERWVLMEFPYMQETPFASVCLAALVSRGYRPVIAHVERYRFVARAPKLWLERFARAGAVLQGDIGSLVGQHGEEVRRFALWLLARGRVAVWGTDVHHPAQIERYIVPGIARLGDAARMNAALRPLAAA